MKAVRIYSDRKLSRQQIWEMKRLWRDVPHVQCKGLCQGACTNVPLMPVEAIYLIEKHAANPLPAWHGFGYKATMMPTLGINGPCEFLREGRCSIYDDRPAVCREYGHKVLTLDCGHDCQPSRPFTNEAASAIMLLMSYVLDIQGAMAVVIPRDSELVFRHLQESVDNLCVDVEMEDGEEISASGNSVTPEPNSVMPCNARDGTLRSHKGL
jgi:Fe-S-cluster containining protein